MSILSNICFVVFAITLVQATKPTVQQNELCDKKNGCTCSVSGSTAACSYMDICILDKAKAACFKYVAQNDKCKTPAGCVCQKYYPDARQYGSQICSQGQYCANQPNLACVEEMQHKGTCSDELCACPGLHTKICSQGQNCWIRDYEYVKCYGSVITDGKACTDEDNCLCDNPTLANSVVCPIGKKCVVSTNRSICGDVKKLV